LPQRREGPDCGSHRGSAAIFEGGLCGGRGQFNGRHSPVAGVVDALGRLPDSDDHGGSRINFHSSTIYRRVFELRSRGTAIALRRPAYGHANIRSRSRYKLGHSIAGGGGNGGSIIGSGG